MNAHKLTADLFDHMTPSDYRKAMSAVPTSVVVASSMVDGKPVGMVVGTFSSVSMDPPLVGFFGDHRSSTLEPLLRSQRLSFCLLRQDDLAVCEAFRLPLEQRFTQVDWAVSDHGTPVLTDALLTVHTTLHQVFDTGDHKCVLAEVVDVESHYTATRPLVFFRHRLSRLDPGHMLDAEMWQLGWDED